jgi:cellulose synthase (UDP-forming)
MTKKMTSVTWSIVAVLILIAIMQPVGLQAQFFAALGGVCIMGVIKMLRLKGIWRQMFLVIGTVVVLRYLYWRVTSTLPPFSEPWNFIPGIMLFMAEVYSISMLAINMVVVADPIHRQKIPITGDQNDWPTVDIFVPTYNEDLMVLGVTLAAARNIDYPTDKVKVYLLDDGGTDFRCFHHASEKVREGAKARRAEFSAFAAELGVTYLTRARNEHAKAGNMNEALKTAKGDIVVVFDADHAPSRDFLKKTIGYFQVDPKLFLVQTPHQFLNPDPIEKNIGSFEIMPSENEMFYTIIQRGLDKWNGSFFCGSAAVLRRVALNEVGGFAGITITEDCETAVELHSRGWNSAYVQDPMIAGFQPETFTSFIGQRSRWCQGMLQILLLKRPAFKRGLSMPQRLAYLSIMLNWLFPLSRFMFMIAPAFFILFDLHIYNASFDEFLAFTVFSLVASTMMQNYIFGTVRWPWISELYEYVQSYHLSRAIVSVILKPHSPSFNVTNKAETLDEDFFSDSGWFHLITFLVLALTVVVGAWRLMQESGTNELLYVVGFWAFFNLVIAGLGLGAVAERKQRRRHYRMPYAGGPVQAVVETDNGRYFGSIKDIAIGGLCVEMPVSENLAADSLVGQTVKLSLVKGRRREDRILHTFNVDVRWSKTAGETTGLGLEFHEPNALDRRAQALLMFPNSEALARYRANRLTDVKVSQGTLTFVKWSATQTLRGLKMATAEIKTKIDARFAPAKVETPKVEVAVVTAVPVTTAQAQQTISAAPAAQPINTSEQRAIPAMPSIAIPHIPVSPFSTGGEATMVEATPMEHNAGQVRQNITAPSMVPRAHEISGAIHPGHKTASSLPSPKQVPVSGPVVPQRGGKQTSMAAPSREVPL